MSEEADDQTDDLVEGLDKKKFGGKKIILFIVLPVLLLIGAGIGVMLMTGGDDTPESQAETAAMEAEGGNNDGTSANEPTELLFMELEPILVNLNTAGDKSSYLKLQVALEVDKQSAMADLEAKMPRVIDNFQVYLRELRLEDLNGSAGMFRLKEELLIRVNEAVYPTRVHDVLFKEMLIN
ncbi:MAG: flagellar basal body protein FliL [Kordiimonas sp.]|nr:flagellar basal body protein FliL [Kordiimonas sp.]|tara:strand:- start:1189 stop:1731 length:543 start_codon:yes stop_codon:yes gene_type:complete